MKFTIIGHAAVLIEADGYQIIMDPWLIGSCYWRSWWHYPAARADLVDAEAISAICYTHQHPDHLSYPSLRRFPTDVRILLARFPTESVGRSLEERGYHHVEEVEHGHSAQVGPLQIFYYPCWTDDTILIATDGKTTLMNMNDAPLSGNALRHVLDRHPRIDFFLRSHAPAQAYPFCYTADDPAELALLPLRSYAESFAAAVRSVRPRWAVPFASAVCYLHPESQYQNAYMVSPEQVAAVCEGNIGDTELVVMEPGDSWDDRTGFQLAPRADAVSREQGVAQLAASRADTIAKAVADENASPVIDFATFRDYMTPFARSIPWPVRRLYPARVAFVAPDETYYVVEFGRGRVFHVKHLPTKLHSIAQINPHLLREAIRMQSLSLVGISKRLKVHLRRGAVAVDAAFWTLLTLYELGYLPVHNLLTVRGVTALAARWREILGYLGAVAHPQAALERAIKVQRPIG